MVRVHHIFVYVLGVFFLLWGIGFCGFCYYAISFKYSAETPVDAVVVLTGGTDRISTAVQQMADKNIQHLLISGVNKSVAPTDMLNRLKLPKTAQPTLGYWAENTAQNAVEVSDWVLENDFKSILLVTSFYHMPRSVFEILKHQPKLEIVPYPVFPKSFNNSVEWVRTKYAWFLFLEYNKFITVHLISWIRSLI